MDKNNLLGGLMAAAFVLLWGVPSLVGVLLSEPPPERPKALKAIINAMASTMLGYLSYLLAVGWAADFLNGLVEKFLGVNPHVDRTVAGVVVAVFVTGVGPAALDRVEKMLGRKIDEVAP